MTGKSEPNGSTPTPEKLREQLEDTRAQLSRTVAALAAKTDLKGQMQDKMHGKMTAVRHDVTARASKVRTRVRETASHAAHAVHTPHTGTAGPGPVREEVYVTTEAVRSTWWWLVPAVAAVLWMLARKRRHGHA